MRSRRARWSIVVCALLCVAWSLSSVPTFLLAQGTAGRILGRVVDPVGAVLSGVKVTAANEATGVSRDVKTNDSGDYVFPELPVGTYRLIRPHGVQESRPSRRQPGRQPGDHAQYDDASWVRRRKWWTSLRKRRWWRPAARSSAQW